MTILYNLRFDDLQFTIYVLFSNLIIYRAVGNFDFSLFTFHFAEGDGEREIFPLKGGRGSFSIFNFLTSIGGMMYAISTTENMPTIVTSASEWRAG